MFVNENKLKELIRSAVKQEYNLRNYKPKKPKPPKYKYETVTIVAVYKDHIQSEYVDRDISDQKIWRTVIEYPSGERDIKVGKFGSVGDTYKVRIGLVWQG